MRPFWLEQALSIDGDLAPALQGSQRADVCIVGGGYTGLWTAIQARQQDPSLDIVILESDLCGAGASGRNGGCLHTWSAKFFTLRRVFGEAEAVRLGRETEAAAAGSGACSRTRPDPRTEPGCSPPRANAARRACARSPRRVRAFPW